MTTHTTCTGSTILRNYDSVRTRELSCQNIRLSKEMNIARLNCRTRLSLMCSEQATNHTTNWKCIKDHGNVNTIMCLTNKWKEKNTNEFIRVILVQWKPDNNSPVFPAIFRCMNSEISELYPVYSSLRNAAYIPACPSIRVEKPALMHESSSIV